MYCRYLKERILPTWERKRLKCKLWVSSVEVLLLEATSEWYVHTCLLIIISEGLPLCGWHWSNGYSVIRFLRLLEISCIIQGKGKCSDNSSYSSHYRDHMMGNHCSWSSQPPISIWLGSRMAIWQYVNTTLLLFSTSLTVMLYNQYRRDRAGHWLEWGVSLELPLLSPS